MKSRKGIWPFLALCIISDLMNWVTYEKKFREKAYSEYRYLDAIIEMLLGYAKPIISNGFPIIFSLEHFSRLVGYKTTYIRRAIKSNRGRYFYKNYFIKKKSGDGYRNIMEPLPSLKEIQSWILRNILNNDKNISRYAKAYIKNRSIRDNAKYHLKQVLVVNYDIKDFFPSITTNHIYEYFFSLGYGALIADFLTKICTLDNSLPQGAPTSPMLSNIILYKTDKAFQRYANAHHIMYTRYADDLTFSGNINIDQLTNVVKEELSRLGLKINQNKFKVMRPHQAQLVTGIIVNEKLQAPRKKRKALRLQVYYIKKFGLNNHLKRIKEDRVEYLNHLIGIANGFLFLNPSDIEIKKYREFLISLK